MQPSADAVDFVMTDEWVARPVVVWSRAVVEVVEADPVDTIRENSNDPRIQDDAAEIEALAQGSMNDTNVDPVGVSVVVVEGGGVLSVVRHTDQDLVQNSWDSIGLARDFDQ